jgi:hypothetical protein
VLRNAAARAFGGVEGAITVIRPERLRFAASGVPGTVRERRYAGAAAFFLVEGAQGERLEVLAAPDAVQVGDRVFVEATRVLSFPDQRASG